MTSAQASAGFDWRAMAARVVIDEIDFEPNLSTRKARIMAAYQHGHLSAQDAEDWIVLGGMTGQ